MLSRLVIAFLPNHCHTSSSWQYCWLYLPCCTFHSHDLFILKPEVFSSLILFIFMNKYEYLLFIYLFTPYPPFLWQPPLCSSYPWAWFCFVMFLHLVWLLDSTYKWDHTESVFPWWFSGKESAWNEGDPGLTPGLGRSPGGGAWKPTPVLLLGEIHGQRSLAGCSP